MNPRSSGAGASYPVFVHRLARLIHASFRPRSVQKLDLIEMLGGDRP